MLCPCISNYFPVVYAFIEGNIAEECPEEVVILSQINRSTIWADCHYILWIFAEWDSVPNKGADYNTNYLSL